MQQYSIFSYRKLSLKLLQFAFFLLTISIAAQAAPPPIQGDYRSKITGNWTEAST